MKYIVILGDGMAGEPLAALGERTTLEAAATPTMDLLASMGQMGLAKMVPDGMKPGSDVANLAVLGYDPQRNYSGRSLWRRSVSAFPWNPRTSSTAAIW